MKNPLIHLSIALTCISVVFTLKAQKDFPSGQSDFYSVCAKYYRHIEGKSIRDVPDYKQFKRWEAFMAPRVFPTGHFNPDVLWNTFQSISNASNFRTRAYGAWSPLGPAVIPANGGGIGRVNILAIDPNNSSVLWVGAPDGGLWKSADGGSTWAPFGDILPNMGVTEIVINPQNSNIMYIGTGDGFGYTVSAEFWGGTYSNGVMKSTDGGTTWNTTGLNWQLTQTNQINALIIHPLNPDILLAGANTGIWKTSDGGATWALKQSGDFRGLEFKPGDPSVVYAGADNIYRSADGGDTWTQVTFSIASSGMAFAVTPADPDMVYALSTSNYIYKSTDAGLTWDNGTWILGNFSYGWYTCDVAVSPANPNVVVTTGIDLARSTDGGLTWTNITDWQGWPNANYSHADHRGVIFDPNDANVLYDCNDGGIFKSSDGGSTWTDISAGMQLMQLYRLGLSATDPDLLYCGAQDNGANKYNGSTWEMVVFADGMECAVDPSNTQIVYASTQNGGMYKSINAAVSFSDVTPNTSADWITTFYLDPSNPQNIYYGGSELYKSSDAAFSWNPITSGQTAGEIITWVIVSDSDPNTIYFSHGSKLYGGTVGIFKTTDGGTTWADISSGLPVTSAWITYIEVDDTDPNTLWVTFSGYSSVDKIYESTDGGQTWSSIAGSLPHIPVNTVVHDHTSLDGLYIGTDFGVYFKNDTMNDWIQFNHNLPNVIISELEIQYSAGKLRAATYGRGVWETDLYDGVNRINEPEKTAALSLNIFPNPAADFVLLDMKTVCMGKINISLYDLSGRQVLHHAFDDVNRYTEKLDIHHLKSGLYNIVMESCEQKVQKQLVVK